MGYRASTRMNDSLSLIGFGLCTGLSLGPIVELTLFVDEYILYQALGTAGVLFGSFSLAALTSKRRSYLYLYGVLISAMNMLAFASLMNYFLQSSFLFNAQVYVGLLMFAGYIIADTQKIIELHAVHRDTNYTKHAMELFIDFVGVFVRILIILLKRHEENER